MKNLYTFILFVVLVVFLPFGGYSQLPFFDGFESGTMDNWETTGEEPAIISLESLSYSGVKFIRVQNSYSIGKQISLQDEETGMVEFAAKMSFTNVQSLIFQVYDNDLRIMAKVHFFEDGKIYAKNVSGDQVLMDYVADIWYLIRLEFDQIAKTYDVYIDNTLLLEDLSYVTANCEYINRFKFYSTELVSSQCYLDAITIEGDLDTSEKDALMALFNATNGSNWTDTTNWGSEEPLGDWYGVTTDIDGKVTQVILNNNQLNGIIPTEIGDLANLEFLALSENQLSGIIPSEIGNCSNLIDLSLSDNQLSGNIPAEIWGLLNLESLNLWTNQLAGNIPPEVGNLIKLTTLDLSNNPLGGSIPEEIWDIVTLEWLLLINNQLNGTIPPEIGNLTNLQYLSLSANDFHGEIPSELASLVNLQDVDLANNRFDMLPVEFHVITPGVFSIKNNWFSFEDLNNMPVGTSYNPQNTIHIYDTTYLEAGITGVIQLPFDGAVNNSEYNWYREGVYAATTSGNSILATEGPGTAYFSLEITNTAYPGFTLYVDSVIVITEELGAEKAALMALYNATDGDNWTDNTNWNTEADLDDWYGVTTDLDEHVIEVNLGYNNLVGNIPAEIGSLVFLNKLHLYNNSISGSIPMEIWSFTGLTHLSLGPNQLSGSLPSEIGDLVNLVYLRLDQNQFTGALPEEIGNLVSLTQLDLNTNQFSGSIPSQIGNLVNLTSLRLDQNLLTGIIPLELANIINLEWLYLNDNQLKGAVPLGLSSMPSLTRLFLENNELNDIPLEFNYNGSEMSAENNQFTFEDLENLPAVATYNPQHTIHAYDTTYLEAGITGVIQLPFDGAVSNSEYNWYREGVYAATTSGNSILATEGPGTAYFSLEITNTAYPGFTLYVDSVIVITEELGVEKAALMALYNATDGGNWTENTNWKTEADLGDWFGVTTDENGLVTEIDLGENNLVGHLPVELGELSNLQQFWLGNNQLTGGIPSELGTLSSLSHLVLNTNQLTGSIPPELGNLSNVTNLLLAHNQLSGSIPIELGDLTALVQLAVQNNKFTGGLPLSIGSLPSLDYFTIDFNEFDAVPETFLNLEAEWVDARNNQFTFEDIGNLPTNAMYNPQNAFVIDVEVFASPGQDVTLQLDFDQNVSGSTYSWLRDGILVATTDTNSLSIVEEANGTFLYTLQIINSNYPDITLNVESFTVTVETPAELPFTEDFDTQTLFNEWEVQVGGSTADTWHWASDYSGNTINGTPFAFVDSDAVGSGSAMNELLISSRIDASNVTDLTIEFDQFYNNLSAEELADVEVYDGSEWITVLHQAEDLGAWDAPDHVILDVSEYANANFRVRFHYNAPGWNWYWAIDNVHIYTGSGNMEKDALIAFYNATDGDNWTNNTNWLSDSPLDEWYGVYADIDEHVLEIDLHENHLNGTLPPEIGDLTHLQMLQLYNNSELGGSLPVEIGFLSSLWHLAIYATAIEGSLPAELGNLTALKNLMLNNNNFSGIIPPELGDLTILERIWLHNNELSGEIPSALSNIDSLNYLYLSGNNLTGTIPNELGLIPKMQNLILSENNLYGEIPESIGNLTLLHDFRIDNNQISGAIPTSFGNLINLFNFYFNSNLLEEIPSSFANLTLNDGNGASNQFTFEDIQNLPSNVYYAPQQSVSISDTIQLVSNEEYEYILNFDGGVSGNYYNWYRDGDLFVSSDVGSLLITEPSTGLNHYYYVTIINENYPDLILETDSIMIKESSCDLSLSSEESNISCFGLNDGNISISASNGIEPYEYSIDSGYTYSENSLFENLIAGNYNLKIRDANSCESDIYTVLITEPILLELSTSTQDLTCFESNDGIIELFGSGGLSPYEYSIDSGVSWQNESIIENLMIGTFYTMVKDSNSCRAYQEVVINQPEGPLELNEFVNNISCAGEEDGSIEIIASGGSQEYQYSIDDGSTFQSYNVFNNLMSGIYSIMVNDANNCSISHEIELSEPEGLGFSENTIDVSCKGGNSGVVQIIGSGGSGGYAYRLGNQGWQEYNVFTYLTAGVYEFSIRDDNSCISSHNITINEPDEILSLTSNVYNVLCFNGDDGQIEMLGNGGATPYEFSINNGDSWQSEEVFYELYAGEYEILIRDDNDCLASEIVFISQPESLPIVSFTGLEFSYCENDMEVVLIGNQAPNGEFTGVGIVDNADGTANFNPLEAGIGGPYEITYSFSDEIGCYNNDIQTTSIIEVIEVNFSGLSDSYCVDADAVVLVGSEAPSGMFIGPGIIDNGDGTASFNPTGVGAGGPYDIIYQYESENSCVSQVMHQTVIINSPNVSFTGLESVSCVDATAQLLVGSHAPEGSFEGPGVIDNNDGTAVFSPSIVGIGGPYDIVYSYTSAEGCSNSISQQTSVYDVPTVTFDGLDPNYCEGASEIVITGSEAPNGSFSGPAVFDQGDGTAYFYPVIAGVGGPYSIVYTFENTNGCVGSEPQETIVIEMPIVSFTDLEDGYCQTNSEIVLTGNYAPEGLFTGEGVTDNGDGTALFEPATIAVGGPYEIKYEYETPEGCLDEELQEVEIYQVDELSFEGLAESYCSNDANILIIGDMAPEGSFAGIGITDNGDGTANFSPQDAGPGGPYIILYFNTNSNGCYSETAESTNVHLTPEISFSGLGSSYCIDSEPIVLLGDQETGIYAGPGIVDNGDGTAIFTPAVAGAGTNHEILYSMTSVEGCYAESVQQVNVEALQNLSFDGLESDYCFSNPESILTGNMAPLGIFEGQGITDNGDGTATFDPQIAGIGGPYIIIYKYQTGVCMNTIEQEVIVHNSTVVSFTGLNEVYCNVNTEFVLAGSEAPLGYFTGEGILDNNDGTASFNPSILGLGGPFIITYHFGNENGCISYFEASVNIVDGPTAYFDYSLGGCVEDALFVDQSTSPNGDIIEWNWGFDDPESEGSNNSDVQNPLHQFVSNQSEFNIKLVVGDEIGCVDSIEQVIAPFSTSTITGHVYSSDGTDVTSGYVLAYLLSEGVISTQVDSVQIAEDGSFTCFEMATCVDYIFRAYANEIEYPGLMPRWHIDAYFWLDATHVSINWDDEIVDNIDINVYKVPVPPEGTSGLGGGVYYTGGKGEPVKNVDVVLEFESPEDKGDEVVGYEPTDELGHWEFDKLGEGTFKISVDIPGLNIDSVYSVTISAPNTYIGSLDYYIDPDHGIYMAPTGIDELDEIGFGSIGVYPNPNTGQFYLEILKAEHISRLNINAVQLWDMEGRMIKDLAIVFKGDHYLSHLNLSDVDPGMYFIKVKNQGEIGVAKFVIQK